MVRFVVEDEDVLEPHQLRHHALEHPAFRLFGLKLRPVALEQRAPALGEFDHFTLLEGMEVRDDDLRAVHGLQHVVGDKLAVGVVTVRIVGLENAETVLDRDARRHDQESAGEAFAA